MLDNGTFLLLHTCSRVSPGNLTFFKLAVHVGGGAVHVEWSEATGMEGSILFVRVIVRE